MLINFASCSYFTVFKLMKYFTFSMFCRRILYYILNILCPCIWLNILSLLAFCLPPDAGEKITLGITVLLSYSVFMLLVAESMPPTSEFVPLIGESSLFTCYTLLLTFVITLQDFLVETVYWGVTTILIVTIWHIVPSFKFLLLL